MEMRGVGERAHSFDRGDRARLAARDAALTRAAAMTPNRAIAPGIENHPRSG
jgi:hypothetical protein